MLSIARQDYHTYNCCRNAMPVPASTPSYIIESQQDFVQLESLRTTVIMNLSWFIQLTNSCLYIMSLYTFK